jgi:hypothetical protein
MSGLVLEISGSAPRRGQVRRSPRRTVRLFVTERPGRLGLISGYS